jgi:hypothetical protein
VVLCKASLHCCLCILSLGHDKRAWGFFRFDRGIICGQLLLWIQCCSNFKRKTCLSPLLAHVAQFQFFPHSSYPPFNLTNSLPSHEDPYPVLKLAFPRSYTRD